jgi:hypothetical protein
MGLRKKKSLVDQAIDQAGDIADAIRPHVESAYGQAKDFVNDTAIPALGDARDKAGPALADARDKAAPVIAEARAKAAPVIADARDRAVPVLHDARAKAAPIVASGAALAGEKATAARTLAEGKVAELKGEQPKKRSKVKTLLVLGVVAGGVAVVAKKLQGGGGNDNWQSSYTPKPAPATGNAGSGPAPTDAPAPVTPATTAVEDPAGAEPGEALSDAAEAPHPVTTPDEPAEVVDVDPDTKK